MNDQIHRKRIIVNGEVFYPITDADSVIHLQKEITDKLPIVSEIQPASGTFVPKQAWLDISEEEGEEELASSNSNDGPVEVEHDEQPSEPSLIEHDDLELSEGNQLEHEEGLTEEHQQIEHNSYGEALNPNSEEIGYQIEHEDITSNVTIVEHDDATLPDYNTEN